ncbi:MAG: hypothetical protein KF768_07125 [Phycisphaeraceae bacterium]|nr:hypothetical protein [Phycisphaeraceae bacterium]
MPTSPRPRIHHSSWRAVNLPKLALAQRRIIWSIPAIYAVCLLLPLLFFTLRAPGLFWIGFTIISLFILLYLGALCFAVWLSVRSGHHPVLIVFIAIAMFFPLINAIVLMFVNRDATAILRKAGVKVGLMGVPPAHMFRLYHGVCTTCGYDVTQLPTDIARCPECGAAIARSLLDR